MQVATVGTLAITVGWLIAFLVLIVGLLGLIGIVPFTPTVVFAFIVGLAVARLL